MQHILRQELTFVSHGSRSHDDSHDSLARWLAGSQFVKTRRMHLSKRPSIQTTKNFSVKALSLKSLVNEHLLKATANTFGGYIFIIFHCFQACYKSTSCRAERALFGRDPLTHGLLSIYVRSLTSQRKRRTLSHCLSDKRNNIHRNLEIACTKLSCKKYIYLDLYWKNTPCSRKRPPPVSDH